MISNVRVTGARTGIDVRGASAPRIVASQIENNLVAGIDVEGNAKPKIENNLIAAKGTASRAWPNRAWKLSPGRFSKAMPSSIMPPEAD